MLRILLIDDNKSDRLLLLGNFPERVFKEAEFVEAASLKEASKMLKYRVFDAILLDLMGVDPDHQGVEAYFHMRKMAPDTAIIVLTGFDDEHLAKELREHGADGYVLKGLTDPRQLYRDIANTVLQRKQNIRVTDTERQVVERANRSSMRLKKTVSGTYKAVNQQQDLAESISASTDMSVLLLQKYGEGEARDAATQAMIAEFTGKLDALTERLKIAEQTGVAATHVVLKQSEAQITREGSKAKIEVEQAEVQMYLKKMKADRRNKIIIAAIPIVSAIALGIWKMVSG